MTTHHGSIPYGKRRARKVALSKAAEAAPDQFRALALPFLPELVEIMFADARDRECIGHRTAITGLLDGLKITGTSDKLLEAILARLNMPNEAALLAASELYRAVQGQDVVAVYRECRRMVDWCESASGPPEVQALLAGEAHTNGNGVRG